MIGPYGTRDAVLPHVLVVAPSTPTQQDSDSHILLQWQSPAGEAWSCKREDPPPPSAVSSMAGGYEEEESIMSTLHKN